MSKNALSKVVVLGSGAFGTAIAQVASFKQSNHVTLWSKDPAPVRSINERNINSEAFSQYKLNLNVSATNDLKEALNNASVVLSCLPLQIMPEFLEKHKDEIPLEVPFVSCSKGMIVSREQFLSEVASQIFKGKIRYCTLSGPSFAQEMIEHFPTSVVVASKDKLARDYVQQIMSNTYFRAYTQEDVLGVEIGGALKNVLAIGVGLLEGLGFGMNTIAAFITRGSKEVQVFSRAYQANPTTFFGLAGIGDLILTCLGKESRNRAFGHRIGKGETIDEAIKNSEGVVEGLPTLRVVMKYAEKNNLSLPLISVLNDYLHGQINKEEALHRIMEKALESESFNLKH